MTAHRLEHVIYGGNWTFNHSHHPLDVAYIAGADLMVKRHVLDQVGPFSPVFFMYNEDTDLCLRIHQAHYRIVALPTAHIQHLEGASTRHAKEADIPRGILLSEQGRQRYYHKNVGRLRRIFAEAIYRWSLHQSWILGLIIKHPSTRVFKQRIDAIHQLNNCHP
jgi:GT2 family glycosyltransferase